MFERDPKHPQVPRAEALAHQAAGRHAEAVAAYQRHLAASPRDAEAWANLGGELGLLGRLEDSAEACRRALALAPGSLSGLVNLGLALSRLERYPEAEGVLRRALATQPGEVFARLALAECLLQTGRTDAAIEQLDRVLTWDPRNRLAFKRRAEIHQMLGDRAGLIRTLDRWIAADPGSPDVVWERGALHLMEGRFTEGWADLEARFDRTDQVASVLAPFPQPRWRGEPFPGRTLLLHWEQGFGDTLMFIRFAARAKALGGRVVALVQAPLREVVATCQGVDEVVAHGEPLPPFDLQLPLMSLPQVLRVEEADIPAEVPYLGIPERVPNRAWLHQVLSVPTDRLRVGLVWAGNARNLNDRTRSLPPACLAPLEALPGVAWHSFQIPAPEVQPLRAVPLGPLLSDFSDTAFALGHMDLVLTADTALAHLAGALGLPVFLMLRYGSEWRWQLGRTDSPWYPTLRIYRQHAPGDWDSVVQDLLADLTGG